MSASKNKLFSEFSPSTAQEWKDLIVNDLKGGDYNKKMLWKTNDGIEIEPFYTLSNIEQLEYLNSNINEYPFVRGNKSTENDWTICQTVEVKDLKEANLKAHNYLKNGVQGIEFKLDFLSSYEELEILLSNLPLTEMYLHFKGSHSYSILFDLLKTYCNNNKIETSLLKGSFNFDPFSYYLLHGEFYNSFEDNMNELFYLLKNVNTYFPKVKVVNVNGNIFSNAGSTITQELAYTLSIAHEYLLQMLEKGLKVEQILPHFRLTFGVGSSYFPEIAKIRTARLLWSQIAKEYASPELSKIEIHSETSMWNKTIFDYNNNILRLTTEAMSAILGGCDSLNTLPFDSTFQQSDNLSERVSRNIQHIIKEEAYFNKVADPAAGSYYIETLTLNLAQNAWNLFVEIEDKGGFRKLLETNFIFDEIQKVAKIKDANIANRKTTILGVNQYPNLKDLMVDKIEKPCLSIKNGKKLKLYRGAEAFEELRLATSNYVVNGGVCPKVYLAQYGNLSMRKARAQFITNFFGIIGFEIIDADPIHNFEWTVNDIIETKSDIIVFCSSDDEYNSVAPEITKMLKDIDKELIVIIAGNPVEHSEILFKAGVDEFINLKTNALECLTKYQEKLGILI